jgi:glycolate oxidase
MSALSPEVYQALQDVVGPENISDEPAIIDSYAFQWGAEIMGSSFFPRSAAVVLPASTVEVQSLIKVCNKYKVKYKALSTGWGMFSVIGIDENAIQIDLRRMNHIIEINEKSMYAVVEPYVTCAQLQAELMKKGFNLNMIGAGCNTSSMPLTAHQGLGHSSVSTSYSDRNLLGVEWILPDGEILKLGSLGSGIGWFCGDGPGPSLRGVLRGPQTVMGGLGVVTKAATKIYPWFGPPQPEIEGMSPYYRLKEFPENFSINYPVFPSWDKLAEAAIEIAESEIAMIISRVAPPMLAGALTTNNDEAAELLLKLEEETRGRPGFLLIMMGDSVREIDYRKRVLAQIMSQTGGTLLSFMEKEEIKREYLWMMVRVCAAVREVFRATGRFGGAIGDSALLPTSIRLMLEALDIKKEYFDRGAIRTDAGIDFVWASPIENGHTGHAEQLIQIHPSREGYQAMGEFVEKLDDYIIKKHYTAPVTVWGDAAHDKYGPHIGNYHLWLRKFKKAFDPNGASVSGTYISAKDE